MKEHPDPNAGPELADDDVSEADVEVTSGETSAALLAKPALTVEGKAGKIIREHVLWSMGAGLVPIPLADIAGVTAIQMDALKKLAALHGVEYTEATGKRFVAALAGGVAARMGASLFKTIPAVGSMLGGVAMSALSGASTYAICEVANNHFRTHGDFLQMDFEEAKAAYKKALEKGKQAVMSLQKEKAKDGEAVQDGGGAQEAEVVEAANEAGTADSR